MCGQKTFMRFDPIKVYIRPKSLYLEDNKVFTCEKQEFLS